MNENIDEQMDLLEIKNNPELRYVVMVNGVPAGPMRADPEDAERDIKLLTGYHRSIAEIAAIPYSPTLTLEELIAASKEKSVGPDRVEAFNKRIIKR